MIVNSISRFSRDKYSHVTVRALLSRLNIALRSVTEPIDDSPTGKLVEGILSTIAQFENDDKAVRTKRGMREALENGSWPFPAPLGYLKVPQPDGRVRVIHAPETAPLINSVTLLRFGTSVLLNKTEISASIVSRWLVFDGVSYRTATTCLAFSYLEGFAEGNSSLASRTGVEPVSPP